MEKNDKTFEISWPFWKCQAILPNAIGHDIFVWLYLSLLVHINTTEGKPPFYINNKKREEQKREVRRLIRSKFSKELISDILLNDIEERIEKDFCKEINEFKDLQIKPEAESFLNSFEYLFTNDLEVKTIYKDAITGSIVPYFGSPNLSKDGTPSSDSFKFDPKIFRAKEPSTRMVLNALKYAEPVQRASDPLIGKESVEELISDLTVFEDEEVYEDDTLDFGDNAEELATKERELVTNETGTKTKKDVKVLSDSYERLDVIMLVHMDEHGELLVDPPIEFPMNKATTAWFNSLFKKAMLTNEGLSKAVNSFFPKPKIQENADSTNLLELFSEKGKLERTQELYEVLGHSKTHRSDLQLEAIRINDNYYSIPGFFHVGRLLDLLGKTIPDNTICNVDAYTFRICVNNACDELGLDQDAKYKLGDMNIYKEYSRPYKNTDKLPFKELLANAILNNLACKNNPFFYKEVIKDGWYLYGMRNLVNHSNGDVRLKEDDIKKLTKLARFIISIQGGKTL